MKPISPTPFHAMEVLRRGLELERLGQTIYHLEVGQPRFKIPHQVLQDFQHSLHTQDVHAYTGAWGREEFKLGIATLYQNRFGVAVSPHHIGATTGSSGAFQMLFAWLACQGKTLALTNPGYPAYRNIAAASGLKTQEIICAHPNFSLDLDSLTRAYEQRPFDAFLLANPSNPTGRHLPYEDMMAILQWCITRNILLISDEIYGMLAYQHKPFTLAGLSDHVIVVDSFSKSFGLPGWRIGWLIASPKTLDELEPFAQNFHICAPVASQLMGEAAIRHDELFHGLLEHMVINRKIVRDQLTEIDVFELTPAEGAFYQYICLREPLKQMGSSSLCHHLLEETGVAITPGKDFDPHQGESFVRLSYAGHTQDVQDGLERLRIWLKNF